MKKITLLLLLSLCGGFTAFAQMMPTGNLTIFSEDGSRFFLILNGERYNTDAQTNVRIEGLPNPYYTCKIVFADTGKPEITRNNLLLTDADGLMQDITYRIKKDKKGKRTLKFYSNIPVQQNMVRPANCATYRYGTPNNMIVSPNGTVYTQQVTQTTSNNDSFGMNMNMGGMSVNVSVPGDGMTTTTTTTTTTTGGGYSQNNNSGNYPPAQYNNNNDYTNTGGCRAAMNTADFEDAKNTITSSNFDDTRLGTAKQIISSNCLTAVQVTTLIKLLTFEENKLDLAKFAYTYCVDRKNYFKVVNAFTFDASKTELNEYIQGQR